MGAPRGNQNAAKGRKWADALHKVAVRMTNDIPMGEMTMIEKAALALWTNALNGDNAALKELGDRLDGKAKQQIEQAISGGLTIGVVTDFGEE